MVETRAGRRAEAGGGGAAADEQSLSEPAAPKAWRQHQRGEYETAPPTPSSRHPPS